MRIILTVLPWLLLLSYTQAQTPTDPIPSSGYLYKIEPGTPGKKIYICGERPFNKQGNLVAAGDLDGQVRQAFENIKTSLATVQMDLSDVAQITYSLKSSSDKVAGDTSKLLDTIGSVYLTDPPTLVNQKSTPKIVHDDVLVEIEVITIK